MIYEYFCPKCDKTKEVIHSITEDPEIKCECGEIMQRRIFGGGALEFHFDGKKRVVVPGKFGRDEK